MKRYKAVLKETSEADYKVIRIFQRLRPRDIIQYLDKSELKKWNSSQTSEEKSKILDTNFLKIISSILKTKEDKDSAIKHKKEIIKKLIY